MIPTRRVAPLACALSILPLRTTAQQVSDDSFQLDNPRPAFQVGEGPRVCIDEGHYNFHTADGRYKPFAEMLRGDGYEVVGFAGDFNMDRLAECALLVVANALSAANESDWTYPHPSAFTKEEIQSLMAWVRAGGRFLLIADHAPLAGAARDLGAVFGIMMIDAYADGGPGPDRFRTADSTLLSHAIVEGRSPDERVDSVTTFTGQVARITQGWEPLLVFGPGASAGIDPQQAFQERSGAVGPGFSVAGWVQGATREWDQGRVVFLGEAAMCTAQLAGPDRFPVGMNDPTAPQNAQFCLNVVRWLSGVLDP